MTYQDIINKRKRDWSCEGLMDGANAARGEKIPFSSPLMNWATYGGIPRNRITEFFGDPGSGKSTTAVDICKNASAMFQHEHAAEVERLQGLVANGNKGAASELDDLIDSGPKKILYLDLEHAFDGAWARTLGIEDSDIDIMQPPDVVAEEILQTVQELIETGELGLVVLDSVPSLVPRAELEKKYGERTVASVAGLLTIFCRKIVSLLTRYKTTLIVINQVRDNMDNPYVVNTPGGKALKFYCSLRIHFRTGQPVDFCGNEIPQSSENPAGYIVNAKIVKQKSAPWDRKNASYYLMCQSGIRVDMDYAQLAVKRYGIIRKSGAWFTVTDPETGEILERDGKLVKLNGMAKVFDFLQVNTDYYYKLQEYILKDIGISSTDVVLDSADMSEVSSDSASETAVRGVADAE